MGLLKGFQSIVFSIQCSVLSKLSSSKQCSVGSVLSINLRSNSLKSNILLTKKKASSLIEVIVASVIIVVIFGIVTLTLNNIIQNNFRTKTDAINNHLNKVVYLYQNGKIEIPFQESIEDWEIQSEKTKQKNKYYVVFTATHKQTKKEISKKIVDEQ